ncbi:MAG: hypothetical protein JST00_26925 [Deltaproteobacteria bacterium]|nr:hypothetical protein [Deltaproteobacteria bacterium]
MTRGSAAILTRSASVGVAGALVLALSMSCSTAPPTRPPVATEPLAVPPSPASSGDAAGTKPATPTTVDSLYSKQVARTLSKVSELRGISATKAVPGVKLDRDQLVARVRDKALREYPAEALRREGQILQIMGFAPTNFDYLAEMLKLLEAQLEGFYEPKNGTMYLASELKGPQAQATLAHELVHALQDQRWDLRSRSTYRAGRSDASMAEAALAEGDATSLMLDYIMMPDRSAIDIPDEAVRELMQGGMNLGDIQSVPHILRSTLLAPYGEGLAFVHARRRKGGWKSVDASWDRLPTTTEQILHADKWEAQEGAIPVPAPTGAALGAGWVREDVDEFGELGLVLSLGEWMSDADARIAASGWGGDKTATYRKGEGLAYTVHVRFDAAPGKADTFAERFTGKVFPALKKTLTQKPSLADSSAICFERAELGPLVVARKERDVVIVAGPANAKGSTWTSAGNCATAKKWADEVLAMR